MANDYRENKVTVCQTTKGIWYVGEITVSTDDVMEAMKVASKAMARANKILGQRNRYKQQKDKEEKQ